MTLHLTPEMLESAYELLRTTPPFKGWKLPPGEEIEFHVTAITTHSADYYTENGRHVIRVSHKKHKTLHSLVETMAHECVHLRERMLGLRQDVEHGASFCKMADLVCKKHGFDRGRF